MSALDQLPAMATVRQFSDFMGWHVNTTLAKLNSGELKGLKTGTAKNSRWRIPRENIKDFLEALQAAS